MRDVPIDRSALARRIRDSIISAAQRFERERPDEHPYALALIIGGNGAYIGYAIATEEALRDTARSYVSMGYRYQRHEWESADDAERIGVWLRWANPDDGWHCGDFDDVATLTSTLERLFGDEPRASVDLAIEAFCADEVLAPLAHDPAWSKNALWQSVTLGVTAGEDPRQLLRSATRVHPYRHLCDLWRDFARAEEVGRRIRRQKDE